MPSGKMQIPGTTDLWVARDGGWLVREMFGSSGTSEDTVVAQVNDPSVTFEAPTGDSVAEPTEVPSPTP